MTIEPAGNQPPPRKGRRTSTAQQAQWQFQADLLDQLSDAVIAVDLEERITYLNRAAVTQYRVDPVGAVGQPLRHAYRYEWLQPEDELAATVALAEQGHWRGENRHIRQDGSTLHVESLVTELRDAEGNATGLLATIRDITDRKQVERNLRASELRYRRLADTLPQLVWTADITGVTDYYNIHIHDFDPAVWQGTTGFDWESLRHPEDRAPTLAAWREAVQQRRPYSCEHRLHMADGSWRWHLSRAQLMQDPDNGLRWYGTATDIHERKMVEEALRASRERLQLGIQVAELVLAEVDYATDQIYLDAAAATLYGLPADVGAVSRTTVHAAFHPDDAPEIFRRMVASFDPAGPGWFAMAHRVVHPDGAIRWLSVRKQVFFADDADGARRPIRALLAAFDITEQKAAEEALRTSEERYRTLFERMEEGFCVFEMLYDEASEPVDYRFLEANPAFARFTGLENAVGKTAYELVPNLEPHWVAIYGEVAHTGEARHFIEGSAAMGRWFEVYAFRFGGPESRRVALLFNNITERKRTEDALRDNEARLQTILHNIPASIYMLTTDQRYLYVNRCYEQFANITNDEIQGKSIYDLFDPATAAVLAANDQRALAAKAPLVLEEFAPQNGTIHTYASIKAPLLDATGEPYALLGISTDITERKATEEALRASEERLRLATEAGGVGIFDYDVITNQAVISPIYAQITGLSPAVAIERERWLTLVHPEDRSMVEAIWHEALAMGASYYYECRLIRPDGVLVWVEVNAWVTTDSMGRGVRITGAVRDITERKQAALHQQFLLNLNSTLRTLTDAAAVQQMVVERLGQYLGVDRCRFNAIDLAADKATLLAAWSRPGLPPPDDITPLSAHAPAAYIASAQAGRTLVVQDAGQDERDETAKTLLLTRGFAATIRVPCLRDGQWVASLHVLQTTPRRWRADEVQLVESVVHHFWPIVEKARTEEALRASEARFRAVQQATPDGYMIFESVRDEQGVITDFRWLYVNPASEQMIGRAAQELQGKCLLVEMPGNREEGLFDAYCKVVETGAVYQREFCYQHEGIDRWFRNTAAKAGDGFAVAFSDITARKQAEADQQLLAELAEQIRVADDADELVAATVRLLGDHLRVGRCLWIEIYGAQQRGAIRAQHCRGLPPVRGTYDQADYSPATIGALAAGRVLVNNDAQQDLRTAAIYETVYLPYQERAYVGIPFLREGRWRGILSVTMSEPRQWQAREISLLETVAERVWLAVDKLRLVAELRANEARYRTIFENAGVSLWEEDFSRVKSAVDELVAQWRAASVTDPATAMRTHCAANPDFVQAMLDRVRILDVNEETVRLYGRPKAELLRPFAQHFDAQTQVHFVEQLILLAAGEQRYRFDGPITTPQGATRHIAFTVVFPAEADGDFTRVLLSGLDVTPLKAAEVENRRLLAETQNLLAQVQEGERFLQSIADTVPNVIYLFDLRNNRNRYANRQVAITLGYTAAEVQALGDQFISTLLHPDDLAHLGDHLTHLSALADGELAEWEYRMQHKSGDWRWLNGREIVFERDAQGAPTVILGALQDITHRKEAEMALRSSEARFRQLAEAMPQIVWTCQADGDMTYINGQWQQYSGFSVTMTLAQGMWPALHPDDQVANREQWRRALQKGEAYDGEVRLRRQDSAYRWFLERAIPVRDEAGVIQQWFGVSMDMHDRKEAEQRQAELVALLEAMLDNAPVGFAFFDQEQRFVRINQRLADQHGRPIADHIGRPFAEIAPRSAEDVGPILEQLFTSGQGIYNREISGPKVANSNELVHALASWFPVTVNGVIQYVGSMMVDITERKRQERHQQFLSELGLDLRLLSDAATILTHLANRLGNYLQVAGCRVNEINLPQEQFLLQKDWVAADAPWPAVTTPGVYPLSELAPPILLAALGAGQTVVVNNTRSDPRTAPVIENYDNDQVHSLIGVPIFRQGEWRATLSVKGYGERPWRPDEVALVETVAGQLSSLLEKVRAEEALRASEERFRQTFAQAPVGVGQAALDGRIELVNPAFCRILGYSEEELIGRNLRDLSLLEDRTAETAAVAQAQAANLPASTVEKRYRRKDGRIIWANRTGSVVSDANGRPLFGVAIIEEITERKAAEERLRQSEERLRLALAGGGMGIWESQIATNHSLWSPEAYALFGLPPGVEITNELFNGLVHPDDLPGLQAAISTLVATGSDQCGEFRIIRPDGAVRWLADRVTVIRDEAGAPVRLLGINFDITERKEREAMIQQQLAEIEAIYAAAPIGLCLVDRDLRYVRINETLATSNGSTIAGQLGRTLAETMPLEGYQIVEPLYRWVIETGAPLLHQEVHESYVDPARARDWLASYYPLKNAEGVVTGVNAIILKITDRKRYERQLKELNASLEARVRNRTKELEQANRELEQFTYAAAHDLRTPLRGIANLVQWINEDAGPVLPPDSQRHLDKLGGRVKRLEKMLEDLLLYSRVGRVRYQPEMVDVPQLVQSLNELLAPPVGFVIKVAPQLPTFAALRIPLELVFRNLLSNAIRHHHAPEQGQAVIMVRDLGAWYEFCVSDNGPGIDPQYHDRIFGMFQTLKPRDQVEGSGIGLALVKKTVESVGGQIRMESALGQGTSFYFTWPKG